MPGQPFCLPGGGWPTCPAPTAPVSPTQLSILAEERAALLELWELRRQQYEQCMDLQLFYRDTEQVDNWMSKQEVPPARPPATASFLSRLLFSWLAYFRQEITRKLWL